MSLVKSLTASSLLVMTLMRAVLSNAQASSHQNAVRCVSVRFCLSAAFLFVSVSLVCLFVWFYAQTSNHQKAKSDLFFLFFVWFDPFCLFVSDLLLFGWFVCLFPFVSGLYLFASVGLVSLFVSVYFLLYMVCLFVSVYCRLFLFVSVNFRFFCSFLFISVGFWFLLFISAYFRLFLFVSIYFCLFSFVSVCLVCFWCVSVFRPGLESSESGVWSVVAFGLAGTADWAPRVGCLIPRALFPRYGPAFKARRGEAVLFIAALFSLGLGNTFRPRAAMWLAKET